MNQGKYVFAQLMGLANHNEFAKVCDEKCLTFAGSYLPDPICGSMQNNKQANKLKNETCIFFFRNSV
jgi:hypothetical protein